MVGKIVFGILSLIPSMLLSSNAVLLICTFVLPVVLYIIVNAKRKDGSFTISANNILVDGVDYARTNINVLFIKAPYSPERVTPIERNSGTIIVSGSAPFVAGMGATLAVTKGVGTAVGLAG